MQHCFRSGTVQAPMAIDHQVDIRTYGIAHGGDASHSRIEKARVDRSARVAVELHFVERRDLYCAKPICDRVTRTRRKAFRRSAFDSAVDVCVRAHLVATRGSERLTHADAALLCGKVAGGLVEGGDDREFGKRTRVAAGLHEIDSRWSMPDDGGQTRFEGVSHLSLSPAQCCFADTHSAFAVDELDEAPHGFR